MARLGLVLLIVGAVFYYKCLAEVPDETKDDNALESDLRESRESAVIEERSGLSNVKLPECHVCVDCPNVFTNSTSKLCPYSFDLSKQTKCVTYAEQYKHMKRPWYIRGCASERGSCSDISIAHSSHQDVVTLLFCQECEGDRCNGVSKSLPDLVSAFLVMTISPVIAKYVVV